MPTSKHSHVHAAASSTEAAPIVTQPAQSAAPTATAPPPVATNTVAVALLSPPPADAHIPAPPKGFVPTNGTSYRGIQPRKAELVALPNALADLGRFTTYPVVLGTSAPPLTQVQEIFGIANQWSVMRNASTAWDAFCRDQEGMAWVSVHTLMDRLRPSFDLAVTADPGLGTGFSGLSSLLAVKRVIANKGVATKRLNKKAIAEGKPPVHGAVGKRRKKAADKAGGAAATTAPSAPTPTATPEPPAPAPAANGAPPAATAPNGAAHS